MVWLSIESYSHPSFESTLGDLPNYLPLHKPTDRELELRLHPLCNSMARRRQGKRGTVHNRNVIQGSNGLTINGGTYASGDAPTTIQYNLLVINVNGSPSLTVFLRVTLPFQASQAMAARTCMTDGYPLVLRVCNEELIFRVAMTDGHGTPTLSPG
ncbi:hypothetical protein BKA70DRAFT_1229605 [Coprinopsis sp. MPI-PUGE-AT-0042]|nr:hypothetical protein BKA70DRAFT_1229605 [Coprinopsis sp. MPI-PUGE-AT-0042]